MEIMKLLPLPLDIINVIISYTIQKIPKTDTRYDLLLTIPRKQIINKCESVLFTNNRFVLVIHASEHLVNYRFADLDNINDDYQEYILWQYIDV